VATILDTGVVPAGERADRLRVSLAESSASSVELLGDAGPVSARLDIWQLGGSYLFRAATSPVRLFRTERQARHDPVPLLALAVQERGEGLHQQFTATSRVRTGAMMGMDMTEAFEFSWPGLGASRALMMPLENLDLPAGQLRHALPRLAQSPLYGLVATHITGLFDAADALSGHPLAADIAAVSTDLARALVASLSDDAATRRETAARTLFTCVREHVRQNIRDPGLTAASIAAAHNVSLRYLYAVCAAADVSLEQLIIRRRLHGIHAELSLPAAERRTIAAVARGWGFRNVTHFTRRFTEEFGLSPRDWRNAAADERRRRQGDSLI
jgi:AraC-like DNA-binding protein